MEPDWACLTVDAAPEGTWAAPEGITLWQAVLETLEWVEQADDAQGFPRWDASLEAQRLLRGDVHV